MENQFQFKPFDKVLVRDANEAFWQANFFSHINRNKDSSNAYCCIAGNWQQCIPYNEETAHLYNTNKPYKKPEPKVWTVKTEEDQMQSYTHDEFLKLIENIKKDKSDYILTFGYTGTKNSN